MNRRHVLAAGLSLPLVGGAVVANATRSRRVAFVLNDFANVIDVAGPWEVFQDVMGSGHEPAFTLFTVAHARRPVQMTGGLTVVPDHDFGTAPDADIIVVPAQKGHPDTLAWLQTASRDATITLSVCTGAFQLARAGLLNGLPATTHHDSWDAFEREFPKVRLQRGRRWVDAGAFITAGGLTSGIDAALHVVSRLIGSPAAVATADFMEHQSTGWISGTRQEHRCD